MGYWLRKRLHRETAVDAGTTYRYKLPTTGFYSAFSVHVEAQRYGGRDATTTSQILFDALTKIELITEGTKVIKSMRARELKALNLFDFSKVGEWQHSEESDGWNFDDLYLLAGRHLQDKEYMFDMSRLPDPELAITNDLTEDSMAYWKADTLEYTIFGWRWMGDPVPSPKGYFRADERVYYETTADRAEKVIEITKGKRIRRILIQGQEVGTTIGGHIREFELQVDEGAFSPVKSISQMQWAQQNVLDYGLDVTVKKDINIIASSTRQYDDILMCWPQFVGLTPMATSANNYGQVEDVNNGLCMTQGLASDVFKMVGMGCGYLNAQVIGFDKEPDLADMLDTRDMSALKLILTERAADKTVSVVVEEEVLY